MGGPWFETPRTRLRNLSNAQIAAPHHEAERDRTEFTGICFGQMAAAQELNGFLLINPSPFTFDFSFGSPMYQIMPAPDTSASRLSLAFTVT